MLQHPPYHSLCTKALRDLHARTISDPSAPAEHVQAAREALEQDAAPVDHKKLVGALTPRQVTRLYDILNNP